MMIRVFLYKLDAVGTHRLPGGLGFETAQPHRDGLRAVEALRASLPAMVFADYEVAPEHAISQPAKSVSTH